MKNKKQVIVIHGGDTFNTYEEYLDFLKSFEVDLEYLRKKSWRGSLRENLGDDFDVLCLEMPNKFNAKYLEWKIWFEKFIPHFADEIILIGHSLGGIFLAKYFSENDFSKRIKATILVAAPYDDKDNDFSLADFKLLENLLKFAAQAGKIIIFHSKDDDVVPFVDSEKYKISLPSAELKIFEDRGHFNQESFPELVSIIKNL